MTIVTRTRTRVSITTMVNAAMTIKMSTPISIQGANAITTTTKK